MIRYVHTSESEAATVRKFGLALSALTPVVCTLLTLPSSFADQDGHALLKQACQRYADAKTYELKIVGETSFSSPLYRQWQETITTAIRGTGNRFRFETQSYLGSSIRVSDGKTETIYHPEDHQYTQNPTSPNGPAVSKRNFGVAFDQFHAIQAVKTLAGLADEYKAAQLLPDATITLDGHAVPCFVVKVSTKDLKKALKPGATIERTVWIDKATMAIRQMITRDHAPDLLSPHIFRDSEVTDRYPVAELDAQPKDTEFAFNLPQGSIMVQNFLSPFNLGADLSGQQAPAVTFKSADGKEISLAALKGKPVLVDFWATWCLPCMLSMPRMADLYQQTKDKGLIFLGVDEDHDAKTAADYLAQEHETFPNFHDSGEIGKALKEVGLPYTILIDAQGKIVFSNTGYSDDSDSKLRAAIAKLGPKFSFLSKSPSK